MEDLFEKEFLKSLGFEVTSDDGVYGKAESIKVSGKMTMAWNRNIDSSFINYFNEKLDPYSYFGIKDDWGTRTKFAGIVRTREDIKKVVELTYFVA